MTERQALLFTTLVEEYVREAVPVSSQVLLKKGNVEVSSATIRNDLVSLEELGLIEQPHTSAGRIPTEKGYRLYVDTYLSSRQLAFPVNYQKILQEIASLDGESYIKGLAKLTASLTQQLVFITFGENHSYYTGLSQLFSQPEFEQQGLIHDVSRVIDHFDEVIYSISPVVQENIEIRIGAENPFSSSCSVLVSRYSFKDYNGIIGLLGPMRMDYSTNKSLLQYIKDSLTI